MKDQFRCNSCLRYKKPELLARVKKSGRKVCTACDAEIQKAMEARKSA